MDYFTYLGSPVNNKGLMDDGVKPNIIKTKRQLVKLRRILRSTVLPIKVRVKILTAFIEAVLLYGFSTVV